MTKVSQVCYRLNECLDAFKIDAKLLHTRTGIGLRKCYRIKECKGAITIEILAAIKKAFPKISISYIVLGNYPLDLEL